MRLIPLLGLLVLTACDFNCPADHAPYGWQEICGRDEGSDPHIIVRRPVYRALVPHEWVRGDSPCYQSIRDTTRPNVVFYLPDGIHITIHTFPAMDIPPQAQVARWEGQIGAPGEIAYDSHGGFAGLYMRNEGVLAWAMQLDPEHKRNLSQVGDTNEESAFVEQMAADYTIKASGPPEALEKHRQTIEQFASTFELIQPLPDSQ